MASFERSRKEEKNYMKPVQTGFTKTRLEKRAIIVSIKPKTTELGLLTLTLTCNCIIRVTNPTWFVLGFTTDDRIRVTNLNPNWQLNKYKRSVTFDLPLGLLTLQGPY